MLANFIIDGESHLITPITTLAGGYEEAAKHPDHMKVPICPIYTHIYIYIYTY